MKENFTLSLVGLKTHHSLLECHQYGILWHHSQLHDGLLAEVLVGPGKGSVSLDHSSKEEKTWATGHYGRLHQAWVWRHTSAGDHRGSRQTAEEVMSEMCCKCLPIEKSIIRALCKRAISFLKLVPCIQLLSVRRNPWQWTVQNATTAPKLMALLRFANYTKELIWMTFS